MSRALSAEPTAGRPRILILCAHLHEDRARKQDRDYLQPMAGLHVASLIDRSRYAVTLYHDMWHGPYDTASVAPGEFELVILTGLLMDFDRMRQLAYMFRRVGAKVVAGGSFCTLFPDFALQYFDAICTGGVEAIRQVMRDHEMRALGGVYRSAQGNIASYTVDHSLFAEHGIHIPLHYIEASRGCNFKCDFCSIPAERARHAIYPGSDIARNIEDSIDSSPRFSLRRLWPMVWFIDNNFSNNLPHLREICRYLKSHKRVRMWGALVTQDLLRNREVIKLMARSKCRGLFTGIESFDPKFIAAHNKRQNEQRGERNVAEDIAYAESLGMMITYGYLFDPRMSTIAEMEAELRGVLNSALLHHPYFLAFVAPLAGTKLFWDAARAGELLPNLRLRDLDGRCIAYRNTRDSPEALGQFAARIFGAPHLYMSRRNLFSRFVRHLLRHGWRDPASLYLFWENRSRLARLGRKHAKDRKRTYMGGTDILDPQYEDFPADITEADRRKYFDPLPVTDGSGALADWLLPYAPPALTRSPARAQSAA